jgi:hypothetical protein
MRTVTVPLVLGWVVAVFLALLVSRLGYEIPHVVAILLGGWLVLFVWMAITDDSDD